MLRSHNATADQVQIVGVLFSNKHTFVTYKRILPYTQCRLAKKLHLRRTFRNVITVQVENCLDKYYMDMNSYSFYSLLSGLHITLFTIQICTSKQHSCPCACQEGIPWSGGIDPFIFKLGVGWRLVVTFTYRPLYA